MTIPYKDTIFEINAIIKHKFVVHPPLGETPNEKTSRHNTNGARFLKWAKINPCVLQVSYPRGGRHWLANILYLLTNKLSVMPYEINNDNYTYFDVFTTHGYRFDYVQLLKENPLIKVPILVRDPRDCALSNAYRSAAIGIPDFGHDKICVEIVEEAVKHAVTYWQDTFERFSIFDHIVVKYESLCWKPLQTIKKFLAYIGLSDISSEDILNAIWQLDQLKVRNNGQPEALSSYVHPDNLSRYISCCKKWLNDKYWLPAFSKMLWDKSGKLMQHFGYTQNSQDMNKF
jgi:hypothetical protein